MDDIFNQRAPRPISQTYYFQLLPIALTSKKLISKNSQFRLKLIKGVQLTDQMKKSASVKAVNGRAPFNQVKLNFSLPSFNPTRNIQFSLVLISEEQNQGEKQVGRHVIVSNQYVNQLKNQKVKYHQLNAQIGEYTLQFQLFCDNSRYSLQKVIKDVKDAQKQGKLQNMLSQNNNNLSNLNVAKSEILTDKDKVQVVMPGEERFMSPTRRIVRKQSDNSKKLMRKGSSPDDNSLDGSTKRGLKFLGRNSQKEEEEQSPVRVQKFAEEESKKVAAIRQKQEQERKEKQITENKKRLEAEKNKAEVQRKRKETQLKKQQQQAQKREKQAQQQKRLQAEQQKQRKRKAQQQRKENVRKQTQLRKQQSQRLREQEQAKRALQQKAKADQAEKNKREQERKIKIEQNRKLRESKKAQQSQTPVLTTSKSDTKSPIKISSSRRSQNAKTDTQANESILDDISSQKDSVTNSNNIQRKQSITVKINQANGQKNTEVYDLFAPSLKKQVWQKPVTFKMTDSNLYDQKGNKIRESALNKKKTSKNQLSIKQKGIMVAFFIISLLLILNAMSPSRKY